MRACNCARASPFQSTHPRGVRPKSGSLPQSSPRVSIHAPAWGATSRKVLTSSSVTVFQSTHPRGVRPTRCKSTHKRGKVSIHAPAWGATGLFRLVSFGISGFQSTHPRGVRHLMSLVNGDKDEVSIHAPAWGATCLCAGQSDGCRCFNPRTRVGCDTLQAVPLRLLTGRFNPRTRVGCDASAFASFLQGEEFQSTHPRGVRPLLPLFL